MELREKEHTRFSINWNLENILDILLYEILGCFLATKGVDLNTYFRSSCTKNIYYEIKI